VLQNSGKITKSLSSFFHPMIDVDDEDDNNLIINLEEME